MNIEKTKTEYLSKRNQLIALDANGLILDSCERLIPIKHWIGHSIFEVFDIFTGFEAEVLGLKHNQAHFLLPMLEFAFEEKQYCLSMEFFARSEQDGFFLMMSSEDDFWGRLRTMQQERNESVILLERIQEQEKALQEYTRRLEAVNNGLDRFAYIVSHDLKSPLRAIGNLSSWIAEGIETGDHSEIEEHLTLLKKRVGRMENLIEGILQYSRAGRINVSTESLNLPNLLNGLVELNFAGLNCELVLSPSIPPIIQTQKIALYQVFANLFSNIRKYGNQEKPQIRVEFSENDTEYEFGVIDNGPGIEPRFHQKIFEIFQTLQSKDHFESTGIGLTIVKKIIEEQGGRIWLDSDIGKGAAFYFTWPRS